MITSEDVPSLGCLCRNAGEQALQRHLTSCRIFSGPTADMTVGGASQNSITALLSRNLAVKIPTLLHHLDISPHPPTPRPSQPRPPCILSTGEALNPPSHLFPSQTSSTEHFAPPPFSSSQPRGRRTISNRLRWSLRGPVEVGRCQGFTGLCIFSFGGVEDRLYYGHFLSDGNLDDGERWRSKTATARVRGRQAGPMRGLAPRRARQHQVGTDRGVSAGNCPLRCRASVCTPQAPCRDDGGGLPRSFNRIRLPPGFHPPFSRLASSLCFVTFLALK